MSILRRLLSMDDSSLSVARRKKPYAADSRAISDLEKHGWLADKVERRNQFIARDWKGFADIIALSSLPHEDSYCEPCGLTLLVQVTSDSNFADRAKKVRMNMDAKRVSDMGHYVEIWSYKKVGNKWLLWRREAAFGTHLVPGLPEGSAPSSGPTEPDAAA